MGWPEAVPPRPVKIQPALFFLENCFDFLADLLVCKNYRKIITGPN
jgi:hypothetical protein